MSTVWGFDHIKDKRTLYHGKDCLKKFCESLREHVKRIIGNKWVGRRPIWIYWGKYLKIQNFFCSHKKGN